MSSLDVRIYRLGGGRLRLHSAIGDVIHALDKWLASGEGRWHISKAYDKEQEVWLTLNFPAGERDLASQRMQELCDEFGVHAVRSSAVNA